MVKVILHVDAALGEVRQHGAGDERVQAVGQQVETGLSRRMRRFFPGNCPPQKGIPRIGISERLLAPDILRQGGAGGDERQCNQNRKESYDGNIFHIALVDLSPARSSRQSPSVASRSLPPLSTQLSSKV